MITSSRVNNVVVAFTYERRNNLHNRWFRMFFYFALLPHSWFPLLIRARLALASVHLKNVNKKNLKNTPLLQAIYKIAMFTILWWLPCLFMLLSQAYLKSHSQSCQNSHIFSASSWVFKQSVSHQTLDVVTGLLLWRCFFIHFTFFQYSVCISISFPVFVFFLGGGKVLYRNYLRKRFEYWTKLNCALEILLLLAVITLKSF